MNTCKAQCNRLTTDAKLTGDCGFVLNFAPVAGCLFVLPCAVGVFSSGFLCHWLRWSLLDAWKLGCPRRCLWAEQFALVVLFAEASGHFYLLLLRSCLCLMRCLLLVWPVEMLCHVQLDVGQFPWLLETLDRYFLLTRVQLPEPVVVSYTHVSCLALSERLEWTFAPRVCQLTFYLAFLSWMFQPAWNLFCVDEFLISLVWVD